MKRFSLLLMVVGFPAAASACPSLTDAHAMFNSGKASEAIVALRCLIQEQPRNLDATRFLMDIQWWKGDVQEAETLAQTILDTKPSDSELLIHTAPIANRFRLTSDLAYFSGESVTSSQVGAEGDVVLAYRDEQKDNYSLGFSHQERVFSGFGVADNNLSAGYTWNSQNRTYVESHFGYSLTARFSARWFAGVEPHYVFNDESDVSLGYQYSQYTTQDTSLVTLSWLRPWNDYLTPSVRVYGLVTSHLLGSALGSLKWTMRPDYYTQAFLAGGRTLEAPGLENPFYSLGISAGHHLTSALEVHLDYSYYHSDFRNESRVTIGLDWFL